jgi:hypothetical protein
LNKLEVIPLSSDKAVIETQRESLEGLSGRVSRVPLNWKLPDTLILIVLLALSSFGALKGAERINSGLLVNQDSFDAWFDGDIVRYYEAMTASDGNNARTSRHPLFPLVAFPPTRALRLVGLDKVKSVRVVIALVGGACIALLFFLLRLLGCRRFDATLFSVVSAVSASSMFWFVVPETYPFGSLSILLALTIVALGDYWNVNSVWYVIVSALTLCFTTTNWLVGLIATFVRFQLRKVVIISATAFCLVLMLWGVEKAVFPQASFFFYMPTAANGGDQFVLSGKSGGIRRVANTVVFHSMVMPAIEEIEPVSPDEGPAMSIQLSAPGSTGLLGKSAVAMWAALLLLGIWGFLFLGRQYRFRIVLLVTFFGELTLYLYFGVETFLYTLHFIPLLVIVAALGTLTALRPVVLMLAGALVVSAGINNVSQFNKATEFVARHHAYQRQTVKEAMELRPDDPWPRSTGHVVLAIPGSADGGKAYHEPGGSFSPAINSFGVSIWIAGKQGLLRTTSDTISPDLMEQKFDWSANNDIPSILTNSNYYQTLWLSAGPEKWKLKLKSYPREDAQSMIVIRSVGPAGGPITSLDWNGDRLLVNDRWTVTITPAPSSVHLGEEGQAGWITSDSTGTHWSGANGWGYARLAVAGAGDSELMVVDTQENKETTTRLTSATAKSKVSLDLPDPRFAASLNAQVAHIMMGLEGRETRPAEPASYDLAWARPEAYIITSLARAGLLDTAKELSTHLAENDFFGGLGSEADSPGLAIWSLEEVAAHVNQPDYDRWLWPHVRRKADLILQMLSTRQILHETPIGPVIPHHRFDSTLSEIAKPSDHGLIVGKANSKWSPLYVTAVSYRGLLDAALLADRMQQPADAAHWRSAAMDLKNAWTGSFNSLQSKESLTYTIWTTGVWDADPMTFYNGLQNQRSNLYRASGELYSSPNRSYNTVAETHPWLFSGREDLVWMTLNWFWSHQGSPGLYTWWEANESKDAMTPFRIWEHTRGWIKRPHVTPEYQTAAEILLLQLDMLAYVENQSAEPTIVIGSGVPSSWLDKSMNVRGISTSAAEVDWSWDGHQMHVTVRGCRCKVRLGPAFSSDTPLRIDYLSPAGTATK